jgi:hypothetical protein
MRVNHRRANALVTQELLYGANIIAGCQQVCGEGMPKRMARDSSQKVGRLMILEQVDAVDFKHQMRLCTGPRDARPSDTPMRSRATETEVNRRIGRELGGWV